jgi:hypothetical protein
MMALTSHASETCVRALGTGGPYRTGKPASLFFMLVARSPQGTVGRVAAWSPPAGRQDLEPQDTRRSGALPVGPEPQYTWRRRSPPRLGGGSRSRWTHGSPGAHLGWEVGSGAVGHVAACGSTPRSLS